jgi:hypothetical protein
MWNRFEVAEMYIPRYTKSYRFLKKQFKMSTPVEDPLLREKQIFGEQIGEKY